jgi:hypothetical protein
MRASSQRFGAGAESANRLAAAERPEDRILEDRVLGEERNELRVVAFVLDAPELARHGQ